MFKKKIAPKDQSKTQVYTKQISVYGGKVYADIFYIDRDTEFVSESWNYRYDRSEEYWYCSASKSFGNWWRSTPREQDFIDAHTWADEQLKLIEKYCTVKIQKATQVHRWEMAVMEAENEK